MISIGARCRIAGKNGAILRRGAALNSPKQCIVPGNAEVTVLELAEAEDGTPRARVSSSSGEGFLSRKLLKPAGGAEKPLRVLGLHGGGASAKVMDFQTTALRRELGDRATWDFLDGTRPWTSRVDPMLHAMFDGGPFYGWYGVDDDGDPDRDYNDKLFDESVNFTYSDVEAGVAFVESYIAERGPFDVICGFSQGTIITTLVTAALLKRGDTPSWRGNVLVCGIPPRDAKWRATLPKPRLAFPAALVFSPKDPMYDYGQGLVAIYDEATPVHEHAEGHRFPRDAAKLRVIADEILRVGREAPTPPPGAAAYAAPPSLAGAG